MDGVQRRKDATTNVKKRKEPRIEGDTLLSPVEVQENRFSSSGIPRRPRQLGWYGD